MIVVWTRQMQKTDVKLYEEFGISFGHCEEEEIKRTQIGFGGDGRCADYVAQRRVARNQ